MALIIACQNDDVELAKSILKQKSVNINKKDSNFKTALMYACSNNNLKLVKLLVRNNARVHDYKPVSYGSNIFSVKKTEYSTPLYYSLLNLSNADKFDQAILIINILIDNGAQSTDSSSNESLITFIMENNKSCTEHIMNIIKKLLRCMFASPLIEFQKACKNPNIDFEYVKFLLPFTNINGINAGGGTALMYCTDIKKLDFLLQNGAKINEIDSNGNTAILHNCKTGNFEILKFLCERGGNPLITNYDRKNALMMATNIEIMKYLLEHYSFDINEKSNHNNTALDYVLIKIQHQKIIENYNIIDFLLDNGAELDIHNYEIVFQRACEPSQRDIILITLFFKYSYKIPDCRDIFGRKHIIEDLLNSNLYFYMEIIKRYIFFFQPSIEYDLEGLHTNRYVIDKFLNDNTVIIQDTRFMREITKLILIRDRQLINLSSRMQLLIYGHKIKTSPNISKCGLFFRAMLSNPMKEYWNRNLQTFISPLNETNNEINPNIRKQLIYPKYIDIVSIRK